MNSTNTTTFDISGCTVAIAKMDLQRHDSGDGNYDVLFDLLVEGKSHALFLQSDEGGDGELSVADFSAGMHEEHIALFEALSLDTTNVGGLTPEMDALDTAVEPLAAAASEAIAAENDDDEDQIVYRLDDIRDYQAPLYETVAHEVTPAYAHVELDEEGFVSTNTRHRTSGTPVEAWNGRTIEWEVEPSVDGDELADFLESEECEKLLQRVHNGHRIEWDGHNNVGRLTGDAEAAKEEFGRLLESFGEGAARAVGHAADWFESNSLAEAWPDGMTLLQAVAAAEADARAQDVVLLGDVQEVLLDRAEAAYERANDLESFDPIKRKELIDSCRISE